MSNATEWSKWIWDGTRQEYYSWRTNALGATEYTWAKAQPTSHYASDDISTGSRFGAVSYNYVQSAQPVAYATNVQESNISFDPNYSISSSSAPFSRQNAPVKKKKTRDNEQMAGGIQRMSLEDEDTTRINENTEGSVIPNYDTQGWTYIENGPRFFRVGRVFKCMWNDPSSRSGKGYSKARRFVVVREGSGCSNCVAMQTYGGQGCTKRGVFMKDHAAVYSSKKKNPTLKKGEKFVKKPFRMVVESNEELDPSSRINFGKPYTIEHNVEVCKLGRIHPDDIPNLVKYFLNTMANIGEDHELTTAPATNSFARISTNGDESVVEYSGADTDEEALDEEALDEEALYEEHLPVYDSFYNRNKKSAEEYSRGYSVEGEPFARRYDPEHLQQLENQLEDTQELNQPGKNYRDHVKKHVIMDQIYEENSSTNLADDNDATEKKTRWLG